jgi:hypothetical protein
MSTAHILAEQGPMVVQAAADGVFDLATEKVDSLMVLLRALAVVVAVIFIIYRAVATKGAMAAILIAVACGALFIYGVWNVTDLQGRVGNEINGAPASNVLTVDPGNLVGHAA